MDGVLSDSEWIYVDKILEVLQEEGIYIKLSEINDLFGQSMIFLCQELKKRYSLPREASFYADRVHFLRDRHIEEFGLFPMKGAQDLVRSLHQQKIPIAVASSAPMETIQANMRRFGLDSFISHYVSGLECRRGKPDPDIYLKAASLLGLDPGDCIVVEDSANGVKAAKAAGMFCYAFIPPRAVPQDLSPADRIITSLTDICIH